MHPLPIAALTGPNWGRSRCLHEGTRPTLERVNSRRCHSGSQEPLGHSTITTTMDPHSHVTDTMQADAAVKIDAAFQVAKGRPKEQK
jgi:hypothetical protein